MWGREGSGETTTIIAGVVDALSSSSSSSLGKDWGERVAGGRR
jgi:hypothetical protein